MLITVTMLAFLVLLLVGLAAYSRVETAIAGNTQRQATARQNALLALDVALGQLQKFAGPDQRVTATAESFGGGNGTRRFTGVWNSDPATTTPGAGPLTWLVSGNEFQSGATSVTPTTAFTTTDSIELVGAKSAGTARDVVAKLQPVTSVGVPGVAGATAAVIGRYAWWVGDQGVKAPVALADRSTSVTYAPFGTGTTQTELGTRIRQQVALGAGAADATTGAAIFEPRDTTGTAASPSNATMANSAIATSQLAFFKKTTGTVGLATLQQNFHAWSLNNFNVLANTKLGGLRQDLSLKPGLLGTAFEAWANYDPARSGYMEDVAAPSDPVPLQAYATNPLRRRYRMTPAVTDSGLTHSVAPVLSFFGLSFSFRNDTTTGSPTNLEVSARCVIGLWNPYSAGLIPEDLQVVITGLRDVNVVDTTGGFRHVDLQPAYGGSLKFSLPFTADGTHDDRSTWLPGRVYNWSALSNTADPGDPGNPMEFYRRDATPTGGSGVVRIGGAALAPDSVGGTTNYRICSVTSAQTLTIELRRASDGTVLRTFTSPRFSAFTTSANVLSTGALASDFAYVFRLPNGSEVPAGETAAWLEAAGRDPRQDPFPSSGWVIAGGQAAQPELLVTAGQAGFPASYSQLLLDRYTNSAGRNYNEDAPVFELPRAPLISLGSLQHLQVDGGRPFAIGNSWGLTRNAVFDQNFFSGLTPEVTWTDATRPLPNPLLTVLRRKPDGTSVAASDVNGTDRVADAYSSKYLMQAGSFNLNSVNPAAWIAVLRSVRFPTTADFRFLNASTSTGTSADATRTLADPFLTNSRVAVFPRFGQSAQETYEADDGYLQSDPSTTSNIVNTPLFRRGLRILSATDVATLASKIVVLLKQKQADSGPFLSLEEFLSPNALFVNSAGATVSLLEKAIEDAALNTETALGLTDTLAEFSSQWLTQGDIMTALAPVLFPRSDTFVIRTYGEAVNPTTAATEGRAWCEAIVQRVPEYVDKTDAEEVAPAALTSALNQAMGRRFKIVSFRWLTRSDI